MAYPSYPQQYPPGGGQPQQPLIPPPDDVVGDFFGAREPSAPPASAPPPSWAPMNPDSVQPPFQGSPAYPPSGMSGGMPPEPSNPSDVGPFGGQMPLASAPPMREYSTSAQPPMGYYPSFPLGTSPGATAPPPQSVAPPLSQPVVPSMPSGYVQPPYPMASPPYGGYPPMSTMVPPYMGGISPHRALVEPPQGMYGNMKESEWGCIAPKPEPKKEEPTPQSPPTATVPISSLQTEDLERLMDESTDVALLASVEKELGKRRKKKETSKVEGISAADFVRQSRADPPPRITQRNYDHLSMKELYSRFSSSTNVEDLKALQEEIEKRESQRGQSSSLSALHTTGFKDDGSMHSGSGPDVSHYKDEDLERTLDISTDMALLEACTKEMERRKRGGTRVTSSSSGGGQRGIDMSTWTLNRIQQQMDSSSDLSVLKACRAEIIRRRTLVAREQAEKEGEQPLPEGWEKRVDKRTGRAYYVDHKNQVTSWTDPRESFTPAKGSGYPYYR